MQTVLFLVYIVSESMQIVIKSMQLAQRIEYVLCFI